MKSLKLLPFLAVLLVMLMAPPAIGSLDPDRLQIPDLYEGDDHPWGGEADPSGGGEVDKFNEPGSRYNDVLIINFFFIIFVPDFDFNADVDNRNHLPASFDQNQRRHINNGNGVR
jgi:hypothetical protein